MQSVVPLACFLSVIRPPGVQYENALLQIAPVDKAKCPFVKDSSDVGFQLFTRHNPTEYQELAVGDDERLFASNMDWHAPTVLYFHAFMEQPDDGSGIMVREAYMQRGDTNVIMIDAHRLEAGPWYFTAAQNTWYIGRFAAQFIDYMVSRGLQLNNTHLVGHSLGAQAAGVAGAALTTGRVSRITGLDPALPLFSGLPLGQRLDASDADFVDVIHTDAGIFGYKEPIGHVDFFPNGGKSPQPGCELEVVVPQQLLLNKCDGTENTRGFYTYYLTSNTKHPHDTSGHSALNQIEPLQTGYKRTKLDSTGGPVQHTRIHEKSKLHVQHTPDVNYVSNNNLRTKRVKRNITTTNTDSGLSMQGGNETDTQRPPPPHDDQQNRSHQRELGNNGTMVKGPDDDQQNRSHHREVGNNGTTVTDNVLMNGSLSNSHTTVTTNSQKNPLERKDAKKLTKSHHGKKTAIPNDKHAKKRQKRFLQLFRSENEDNFVFRALNFLMKNRRSVVPIISVVRDISTMVRSGNGELNHVTREKNNYVGFAPPTLAPVSYSLELGNEGRGAALVKRLLGLAPRGDRLTIGSG